MTHEELERMCIQASALRDAGNLEAALDLWQRAAAHGSGRALNNLGADAYSGGDIAEAKRLFSLAAAAQPPDAYAMFNLGILADEDGQHDLASRYFEQAGENGHADGAHNRGQIAMKQQDMEAACIWWQRAAELGHKDAAYNLGIFASKRGDNDGARIWFTRAAELGHAEGMNNLGVALKKAGDRAGALELYERAAAAGSTQALYNLSEIAEGEHRIEDAIAWMQRATEGDDERAYRELARLQLLEQLENDFDVNPLAPDDLISRLETLEAAAHRTDLEDSARLKYFATYVRAMCREPESYQDLEARIAQWSDPFLLGAVIENLDTRDGDSGFHEDCVASVLLNPATKREVLFEQAHAADWGSDLSGTMANIVFHAASTRQDIDYLDLASLIYRYLILSDDGIIFHRCDKAYEEEELLEDLRTAFMQFQQAHAPSALDVEDLEDLEEDERLALASHPMTPLPILRTLAADADSDVRRFVATNPSSDEEIRSIAALLK